MTRRRDAAAELIYHAHLLENMEDAVLATDGDFVLTAWNQGAERMLGWTAEEALGRVIHELIPTSWDDEGLAEQLRELRTTGRWRGEGTFYGKDGSGTEAEGLTIAVDGSLPGYLCIMRDVGEMRRFEIDQERLAAIVQNTSEFAGMADLEGQVIFVNPAGQDLVGLRGMKAVRETEILDYFHPDDRAYVRDVALPAVIRDGRWKKERELRFQHFETGAAIAVQWDAFRIDNPRTGEPVGLATVTADITEQKRIEEALRQRTGQQAVLAELGLRALAADDIGPLMDEAVELVARTLEVEFSKVTEVLPDGGGLLVRAGVGWKPGVVGSSTEPAGHSSQAGYTLLTGLPTVTYDPATEDRFDSSDLVRGHEAQSAVCVVIHAGDQPFGVLGAMTTQLREFSEYDVSFMQSIANVLATAVERLRSQEDLRAALEAERSRIARDLHDEALPDLAHALAGALGAKSAMSDPDPRDSLDEQIDALKRVGQQVRRAIYDLRLADDEERPFVERIAALVERHRELSDFEIELEVHERAPRGPVGPPGTEALRIVAEALTNARRHSNAREARVELSGSSHQLCVEVVDEGRGFDPQAAGAGLVGMRERAALLGGRLSLETSAGEGTRVKLELPGLPAGTEEEELRVLLVEDHAAVREAIASAFSKESGIRVVGEAASLAEARPMLEEVDIAVVDLGLPDGYGDDLIRELSEVNPRAQALVLSASLDRAEVARAVESGAAGVLNKTVHLDEVVSSVRRLRAGEALLPMDEVVELLTYAVRRREQERDDRSALSRLTPRELEVLQLLADGLDSREMADQLHITVRTQRNHVANILSKLGVHSQLQALVFALRYDAVRISSAPD